MLINNAFININRFKALEDKGTLIITHGLAEHSGRFEDIAKRIVNEGYNVITHDLRGHGKSQGKRGSIKSYKLFIEDLNTIIKLEKKSNPNQKIYLLGHSMGGLITNLYNIEYGKVDGAIIVASPLDYIVKPTLFNKITFKLMGSKKRWTNFADEKLSHNAHNLNDPLNLKYFRVDLIYQTLIKGLSKLINNFNKINLPLLFLYGKKDLLVPLEKSLESHNKFGSKNKRFITYDESKHDLLHDIEKEKVLNDIVNWLNERGL